MPNELPRILDWAWRKGHALSSGSQIAPEVKAVAVCVAAAVAASSCAHTKAEKAEAVPPQQAGVQAATAEFPKKLSVPESFQCTNTCGPRPQGPKRPLWQEELENRHRQEMREWDKKIKPALEALETARKKWLDKDDKDAKKYIQYKEAADRYSKLQSDMDKRQSELWREESRAKMDHRDDVERFERDSEIVAQRFRVHLACMDELEACQAREKETAELAVDISRINSVEPLALNMEIVPAAARPLVERYLQLDRQFCNGFPATAGEFIKLKPKWESVTRYSGVLHRMMQTLDAQFQQYGAFEAFYAMQELVEFDEQFRPTIPPEIFAVINADFQRKTKLWWKYVREDVRGLGLVYDSFQARDEAARKKPPPKSFLPYKPGDPIIPY